MSNDLPAVSVLRPVPVTSQEQFVAALRRLREHSGLTFKQIERVTSARGSVVLPASTLATALQRRTVPRAEVVAALVWACGGGPEVVDEWLAVRSGLIHPMDTGASINEDPSATVEQSRRAAPTPPRRCRRPTS